MAAQDIQSDIFAHGLWPQGDARDPLGVWGGRLIVTASAGGGPIKVRFSPGAGFAGAYLYTCYSAQISPLSAFVAAVGKCRLLTNWPDISDIAGVTGYGAVNIIQLDGSSGFTAPFSGPTGSAFVKANDRFLLLFDPRPVAGAFDIVELELNELADTTVAAFEAWGYYWDRSVLQTPGGLRHPGSS